MRASRQGEKEGVGAVGEEIVGGDGGEGGKGFMKRLVPIERVGAKRS